VEICWWCSADRAGDDAERSDEEERRSLTRIIGGVAGGRRIAVPPRGTRPTTDRVRESLFNIVTARMDLTGLAVLDLYAGSGALGLEALSRGAVSALFVESDPRTATVIARNIETLGLPGATVRRGAVAAVLASAAPSPVDLVLADPPYDVETAEVEAVVTALSAHGWVRAESVMVIERAAAGTPITWPDGWSPWPERVYGDTRLELAEHG
jgi:16S rRNA (guanine966-N2)-methyltransferase